MRPAFATMGLVSVNTACRQLFPPQCAKLAAGTTGRPSRINAVRLGTSEPVALNRARYLADISLKAAFGNIGKNDCGSCHERYRIKKS
jgi:hypothetical protein